MNNSLERKTIENIRKRLNLEVIDKPDTHRILNRQSDCSLDDEIGKNEKYNFCSFDKGSIKKSKPLFVGFCVLE